MTLRGLGYLQGSGHLGDLDGNHRQWAARMGSSSLLQSDKKRGVFFDKSGWKG
jgi:hypothetical protein